MRWLAVWVVWWCCGLPTPGAILQDPGWRCPGISKQPAVECDCDMPHTLRCTGDSTALEVIGQVLRAPHAAHVSLLDCTLQNVTSIKEPLLEGVALHGLVVSSGELREVTPNAFSQLASPLQALGLPNNRLTRVPVEALESLPQLDRLDLSGNLMEGLDADSFKGLRNLSFVDLSDNNIAKIAANALSSIPHLRTLRLRGNKLTLMALSKLLPMPTLEEIDLSGNSLVGPLDSKTFPKMDSLKELQISHNSLSSIKMGALQGLVNLTSLSLNHNQIDVLEDHAFHNMKNLISLDLAHNRIVAVSGASLAHLENLIELDLRNNFLRALTADLIQPLKNLKKLKLDENEITIVASDALKPNTILQHLTLSENPLNCDCSLTEFAIWLNNSSLSNEDKITAVCTTPPNLENGNLVDVVDNLLCGEDEQESPMSPPYKAKVNLKSFNYDGNSINLAWAIEDDTSYTCNAIFVYEEEDLNEILLESTPLHCNSSEMTNPKQLNVTIPQGIHLEDRHNYRYCIVLFDSGLTDDVSLILGCSDVIPLVQNIIIRPQNDYSTMIPKVLAVKANLSSYGSLSIDVEIYPKVRCEVNVAILEQSSLLSQRRLNCSDPKYVFVGLSRGIYRVCANVVRHGPPVEPIKPHCVTVFPKQHQGFTAIDVAFVTVFLLLCIGIVAIIWGVRKVLLRPKLQTHQCFIPPEDLEDGQHNRYVKLEATTKL